MTANTGKSALAAARQRVGLTQAHLAEALGVRQSTVSMWERRALPQRRVAAVAAVLGCDARDFVEHRPVPDPRARTFAGPVKRRVVGLDGSVAEQTVAPARSRAARPPGTTGTRFADILRSSRFRIRAVLAAAGWSAHTRAKDVGKRVDATLDLVRAFGRIAGAVDTSGHVQHVHDFRQALVDAWDRGYEEGQDLREALRDQQTQQR